MRLEGLNASPYDALVYHIHSDGEGLEKYRTKAGTFNYLCGVEVPAQEKDKYTPVREFNGKYYVVLGKTYNVPLEAEPGDNLEVRVEEINVKEVNGKVKLAWQDPNPKDRNVSDPVADVKRALAIAELLEEKLLPGK